MRERIEDSGSLGVAMREDSTLGIIDALLKNKKATPDQIINALCNQKVCVCVCVCVRVRVWVRVRKRSI